MRARMIGPPNLALVAPRGNTLTPEQNERIRLAVVELLRDKATTQDLLGKKLKIKQPQISKILRREGTSYPVAERLAAMLGFGSAREFFEGEAAAAPERWVEVAARYPNLADAVKELGDRISRETIASAQAMALHAKDDPDFSVWVELLKDMERKARRREKTGAETVRHLADEDDTPPAGR